MKRFGFILVTLFALFAHADNYSGAGKWQSNSGESGEYHVDATIEADGDLIKLSQTLTFPGETLNLTINLQPIDDNFYNVLDAASGDVIGQGYCWVLEGGDKLCHSNSHYADYVVESTIKKQGDTIYRIGSKTNYFDENKIIWIDSLQKQYDK